MGVDDSFAGIREIASVIRLGSGLLGKSAIVIGFLVLCVGVAIFRLHDDRYIFAALVFGAVIFFAWFVPIIRFADKHPDAALLEGSQWAQHQKDQLAAKGLRPSPEDLRTSTLPPGSSAVPALTTSVKKSEQENLPHE